MEELEGNELEGLQYDELILDDNAHKIVGKLTKSQGGNTADIEIEEGTFWVVTGLGQLNDTIPDKILAESLKDTIIISKTQLIEFIKNRDVSSNKTSHQSLVITKVDLGDNNNIDKLYIDIDSTFNGIKVPTVSKTSSKKDLIQVVNDHMKTRGLSVNLTVSGGQSVNIIDDEWLRIDDKNKNEDFIVINQ